MVESDGRNLKSHILPNTVCKLLNNAVIVINLWWSRDAALLSVGMGLATVFSFVFGYLLIISLNIGLTYQISRKRDDHTKVGIFYQRALLFNFLTCAFLITPLLYLSKHIVHAFEALDPEKQGVAAAVGDYLYQLVPSIYAFAFYDTTQSYLQAQGHILAPLLIQVLAVFLHLALIGKLGAAWSKNVIDVFSCVAIYVYITLQSKPLKSWIQWTIKCINGWGNHMKFLEIIGLTTYIQAIFLFLFSFLAYRLPSDQLVVHICFINIYQLVYLMFIGIKQGALSTIGFYIKKNLFKQYHKECLKSIYIFVISAIILTLLLYIYEPEVSQFFLKNPQQQIFLQQNLLLFSFTVLVDAFHIGVSSILKAFCRNYSILKLNTFFCLVSLLLSYYLCYHQDYGFKGLWWGWLLGVCGNSLCELVLLWRKERQLRKNSSHHFNQGKGN